MHREKASSNTNTYTYSGQWSMDMLELLEKHYNYGWEFSYRVHLYIDFDVNFIGKYFKPLQF